LTKIKSQCFQTLVKVIYTFLNQDWQKLHTVFKYLHLIHGESKLHKICKTNVDKSYVIN